MALERYLVLPAEQEEMRALVQKVVSRAESYNLESHGEPNNWTFVALLPGDSGFPYEVHLAIPQAVIKPEELAIVQVLPEEVNLSFKDFIPQKPEESLLVLNINNNRAVNDWGFQSLVIKSNGRRKVSIDELGVNSLRVFANFGKNGRGKSRVLPEVVAVNQEGLETKGKNLISEAVVFVGCYARTHDGKLISGFVVEKPKMEKTLLSDVNEKAYKAFLLAKLINEGYSVSQAQRMVEAVCQDLSHLAANQ